eukprot:scaffold529_cov308-Pinguiococcus_pyrenoidosus.AAC.60
MAIGAGERLSLDWEMGTVALLHRSKGCCGLRVVAKLARTVGKCRGDRRKDSYDAGRSRRGRGRRDRDGNDDDHGDRDDERERSRSRDRDRGSGGRRRNGRDRRRSHDDSYGDGYGDRPSRGVLGGLREGRGGGSRPSRDRPERVHRSFEEMGLKEELLRGVYSYGFEKPSAIQQRAIKPIIQGRDMIAQSQSGTGKTAVFCIGVLQNLDTTINETQALILSPTRELAEQTQTVCLALGDFMNVQCHACIGGKSMRDDIQRLEGSHRDKLCLPCSHKGVAASDVDPAQVACRSSAGRRVGPST